MNGYYITSDNPNIKVPLEPQDVINLRHMNLIELVLPWCKEVYCERNYLTELIIPICCKTESKASCHSCVSCASESP